MRLVLTNTAIFIYTLSKTVDIAPLGLCIWFSLTQLSYQQCFILLSGGYGPAGAMSLVLTNMAISPIIIFLLSYEVDTSTTGV